VWEVIDEAVFPPDHPYHHLSKPLGRSLRGLGVAEVRAFLERYYTPERARLVISGAFDRARARQLVTQYFGSLRAVKAGPRRTGARPVLGQERRIRLAARVDLPAVTLVWSTPAELEPDDATLDTIAELLAGPRAGVLRLKLIDELHIATSVFARQYSKRLGSVFRIDATAAPGHTAPELLAAIDDVLRDATAHPPSRYLLMGSVLGYVIDYVFRLQTHADLAFLYAYCDEHGVMQGCVETTLSRYLKLTALELSKTIARQLPLDRRVVIEVVPTPEAPPAGELRESSP
jgi:zinc protease